MTGLDKRHTGNAEQGQEGAGPRFPGAPGGRPETDPSSAPPPPGAPAHSMPSQTMPSQTMPSQNMPSQGLSAQGTPLSAPPPAAARQTVPPPRDVRSSGPNAVPMTLHGSPGDLSAPVEGRITIGNAVIGKIAAFAALEVDGVAGLTLRDEPAATGVRVVQNDDEVTLDVAIAVEYGTVIRDVATMVKANVARVAAMMLGTRVAAVNVSVEDVRQAARA
ncbi:Asp23/Gls24 family envelope stress response protein [Actinomadura sp. WMMA1423]|uniref:Asp23/Gls24 family envelope stress response protein n=1 Tax=Actinomadura sp. WMMA1423 TaxID=2591108 RepID=UPI00143DD7DB|nr:Asp23/Gls24 family envelope stress response protein [Actinomadura sp. WMMA1423]